MTVADFEETSSTSVYPHQFGIAFVNILFETHTRQCQQRRQQQQQQHITQFKYENYYQFTKSRRLHVCYECYVFPK